VRIYQSSPQSSRENIVVQWSSEDERNKERGTRRSSAQRLEVVLLQGPERGLERLLLLDLLQGLE
jgi:hypothetical protein